MLIVLTIFVLGCDKKVDSDDMFIPPVDVVPVDNNGATPQAVDSVVDGNNKFAIDMYNQLKDQTGNVFFSPYSISSALAMTYEGAKGQTAEEMKNVFYFPEDGLAMRSSFAELYNVLNKPDKEYTLSTANALWAEQSYTFLPEYLGLVEQYYGGKTINLDFKEETEKSRKTINDWVEDQTNNKIKDLIPVGVLDPYTKLVLTNAIYFYGNWSNQFEKEDTRDKDFFITPDNPVEVEMMAMYNDMFNYAESDGLQILKMPYKGNELSMLFILPEQEQMDKLEDDLSAENLMKWNNKLEREKVNLFLPKFKFETKTMLADTLYKMGMPTAFTFPIADFSGMDGTKSLIIDEVIHQAFVEVNEKGTEAAAATAVVMTKTMAMRPGPEPEKPKIFNADHPFIFLIQEDSTGSILFMGKVVDPSK